MNTFSIRAVIHRSVSGSSMRRLFPVGVDAATRKDDARFIGVIENMIGFWVRVKKRMILSNNDTDRFIHSLLHNKTLF